MTGKNLDLNATAKVEDNKISKRDGGGGGLFSRLFRSSAAKAENNQIRAELLARLGETLGLKNFKHVDHDGTIRFDADCLEEMSDRLGNGVLKVQDFGLNGIGEVVSGRPLTFRRIKAIVEAAEKYNAEKVCGNRLVGVLIVGRIKDLMKHYIKERKVEEIQRLCGTFDINEDEACGFINEDEEFDYIKIRIMVKAFKSMEDDGTYGLFRIEGLSDDLGKKFATKHRSLITESFTRAAKKCFKSGVEKDMVRCGTYDRYGRVSITKEGKVIDLKEEIKKINSAKQQENVDLIESGKKDESSYLEEAKKWMKEVKESELKAFTLDDSTIPFCAILKKEIPNRKVLTFVTSQLGSSSVSNGLGIFHGGEDNLITGLVGEGNSPLQGIPYTTMRGGNSWSSFSGDAITEGKVELMINKDDIVIRQRFPIGPQLNKIGGCPITLGGKGLNIPLFTLVSTIRIPKDQQLDEDAVPEFTPELRILNAFEI